jgi:hypothetical protein
LPTGASHQCHQEKSVGEARGYPIRIERRRNAHPTLEGPRCDLHLVKALDALIVRCATDSADAQRRPVDADADVFAADARDLDANDDGVFRLEDIDVRLPAIPLQPVGKIAIQF